MTIKEFNINELKEYENNPRHNDQSVDAVASSIKEFGFKVPIIIDRNNVIIAGHTRLKASKKLGLKSVPCIIADDLTDDQIKAFRLADNKVSELSFWDEEKLASELDGISLEMEQFGFELSDFALEQEQDITEDEAPEVDEDSEPIAQYGQVYKLGNHRLMCGDSTKKEDVDCLVGGAKIDLVLTDPPYGMFLDTDFSSMHSRLNTDFAGRKMKGGKYEKVIGDNEDFNPQLINTIFDNFGYCKEIFLWGADYYADIIPNRNEGSWLVWDKRQNDSDSENDINPMDKGYGSCFELCWSKTRHKRDIIRIRWAGLFGMEKDDTKTRIHPTQKPRILAEWFIQKYSKNENDNVADLFGGSGSTLMACEQLNRNCFMMEFDPKYVDVIIKRWEQLTGNKCELIKDGEKND